MDVVNRCLSGEISGDKLVTTRVDGAVLYVTLQRPEKRNALSRQLLAELANTFTTWRERDEITLAVLTGAGDKAFASGGDLKELDTLRTESEALAFSTATRAALDTIRHFPVPVVAVLNGDALGGGAELALACDIRIARAHARIGFLQGQLNIATSWGGGTDLFNVLSPGRALFLLCTAEVLSAQRALELGLLEAVAPVEDAEQFIDSTIARLAARKPQVMRAFKSLALMKRSGASSEEQAKQEGDQFARTWVHDDHWAAVAAFMNR